MAATVASPPPRSSDNKRNNNSNNNSKHNSKNNNNNNKLRHRIHDTIQNIEHVMTNIHLVLGDMGVLVQQIDNITEKLEHNYKIKLKRPEILLDANRNQYDVLETPGYSNQSKLTMPSPYMDYTYLELTKSCEVCVGNVQNFTYNEKYPLWIQYDTWKTENTVSDMSEVTSGSDTMPSGSGSDGCSKSWKSISNTADTFDNYRTNSCFQVSSENKSSDLVKFPKCCTSKAKTESSDKYCGVYEKMMEQQLEGIEPAWHDDTEYDVEDSFSDGFSNDSSRSLSNDSFSLSDEHVIHYNKECKSWTSYKVMDVVVREFSDSN